MSAQNATAHLGSTGQSPRPPRLEQAANIAAILTCVWEVVRTFVFGG